jgi:ParB-like chromosome segregation protein Spo0J
MSNDLPYHALANIFPLLEGAEFDELVADVRDNGLLEPIVVYDDQILDGRNRFRACKAAGIEPTVTVYQGDDPVAYVISLNLRRRHLDESQRAMVAAKLATLKDGQRADLIEGLPIGRASDLLNVGERSVARAREVQEHGAPELQRAVERGDVSVSAAADLATLPEDEQREIVARGEREILEAAKQIRGRRAEQRCTERMMKIVDASRLNTALPERRFPVILADPPWKFDACHASPESGTADTHYPPMELEAICALPVANRATPAAVLFLWTPASLLPKALRVVAGCTPGTRAHLRY